MVIVTVLPLSIRINKILLLIRFPFIEVAVVISNLCGVYFMSFVLIQFLNRIYLFSMLVAVFLGTYSAFSTNCCALDVCRMYRAMVCRNASGEKYLRSSDAGLEFVNGQLSQRNVFLPTDKTET